MKKLMLMVFVAVFNFGCESGLDVGETVSTEEACDLCKESRCKTELFNCNKFDLCVRFDSCIEQKHYTCDQCSSNKDLTSGYPSWKELANCIYYKCSDVCETNAVLECSN